MSKASEYASAVSQARAISPKPLIVFNEDGEKTKMAAVTESGEFEAMYPLYLTPANAIALAHWILDTFGETEEGK